MVYIKLFLVPAEECMELWGGGGRGLDPVRVGRKILRN